MAKKTTTTTTTTPLYLQVTEERSGGYGGRFYHLTVRVRTQRYRPEAHGYVPDSVDDTYGDGPLYSGLRLRAQGDEQSQLRPAGQGVYGWSGSDEIEYYDVLSFDVRKGRRMLKTLETITRKLEKLSETRASARSFGEQVGRLAEAIGAAGFVFQGGKYEPWQWTSIGDGVYKVDRLVAAWQQEAIDAREAATAPAAPAAAAADDSSEVLQ